ncbi:hypothetical protein LINPERPRIM_LOCUS28911 [Linum perenne]
MASIYSPYLSRS